MPTTCRARLTRTMQSPRRCSTNASEARVAEQERENADQRRAAAQQAREDANVAAWSRANSMTRSRRSRPKPRKPETMKRREIIADACSNACAVAFRIRMISPTFAPTSFRAVRLSELSSV